MTSPSIPLLDGSTFQFLVFLGTFLFVVGATGVVIRRNPLVMFMSLELMLNSVNLILITYGARMDSLEGQIFTLMVIVVAAAEVVIGLALVTKVFRAEHTMDIDDLDTLGEAE